MDSMLMYAKYAHTWQTQDEKGQAPFDKVEMCYVACACKLCLLGVGRGHCPQALLDSQQGRFCSQSSTDATFWAGSCAKGDRHYMLC